MAISCPTCGTPADARGEVRRVGRLTRCGKCGTAWFARLASDKEPARQAASNAAAADISDAIIVEEIPAAIARPAMEPPPKLRPMLPASARPALRYGVIGAAVVIGILLLKAPLVAALPQLNAASAAAVGLEFKNIQSRIIGTGASRTVVVEGAVLNTLGRAVDVPALRITLKTSDGTDVSSWVIQPATSHLAAGQSIGFKSARVSLLDAATQVTLSLAN
jgi:hypothetical protein